MQTQIEREILAYLSDKDIKFVVPEDKEHDYFQEKRRKVFQNFQPNPNNQSNLLKRRKKFKLNLKIKLSSPVKGFKELEKIQ